MASISLYQIRCQTDVSLECCLARIAPGRNCFITISAVVLINECFGLFSNLLPVFFLDPPLRRLYGSCRLQNMMSADSSVSLLTNQGGNYILCHSTMLCNNLLATQFLYFEPDVAFNKANQDRGRYYYLILNRR